VVEKSPLLLPVKLKDVTWIDEFVLFVTVTLRTALGTPIAWSGNGRLDGVTLTPVVGVVPLPLNPTE
jgi:hypothetical protein